MPLNMTLKTHLHKFLSSPPLLNIIPASYGFPVRRRCTLQELKYVFFFLSFVLIGIYLLLVIFGKFISESISRVFLYFYLLSLFRFFFYFSVFHSFIYSFHPFQFPSPLSTLNLSVFCLHFIQQFLSFILSLDKLKFALFLSLFSTVYFQINIILKELFLIILFLFISSCFSLFLYSFIFSFYLNYFSSFLRLCLLSFFDYFLYSIIFFQ